MYDVIVKIIILDRRIHKKVKSDDTKVRVFCSVFSVLQRAAFSHFPELQDFALSNVAAVDTRESLTKHFGHLR